MKQIITALSLAFATCLSVIADEVRTNAPSDKVVHASKGTRVWISSFALGSSPITVSTGHSEWPVHDGAICTPRIPLDICRDWRTNYPAFRQGLISAAEQAHLDSASLAKVLPELDDQKYQTMAILPVEAQSAEVKGELAWVVTYYWEYADHAQIGGLSHIMARAFAQRTLKLIWGMQCD
jgi:hypothetical protein